MRRHAKAPSAGTSTRPQLGRLGRIVRGALAVGVASGEAKGSGSPSSNAEGTGVPSAARTPKLALIAAAFTCTALFALPSAALAAAPTVTTEAALHVGPTAAYLHGTVNPNEEETVFWFEYGTEDCASAPPSNPCTAVPLAKNAIPWGDETTASGAIPVPVERGLTELQPETTYHFRLLAENASGTSSGLDETFTTASGEEAPCPNQARRSEQALAFLLPDCRAWEMVSPPDKNGNDVMAETSRLDAAATESPSLPAAALFASNGGFGDLRGTSIATDYLAQRDATPGTPGWTTHAVTPPQEPMSVFATAQGLEPHYELTSADLSQGIFRAFSPLTDAPNVAGRVNLYRRGDLRAPGAGSYQLLSDSLTPLGPEPSVAVNLVPKLAGASADFRHVVFESPLNLTADASGENIKLYKSDDGALRLLSDGSDACPNGTSPSAPCSIAGMGATTFKRTQDRHVISTDGSRVNFTSPVQSEGRPDSTSQLYQLDDRGTATSADDATIQISASEKSSPDAPAGATFNTASTDGSVVYFSSEAQLTETPGYELYVWERQATNEQQSVSVDATGGSFTLSAHVGALDVASAAIPVGASAGQVQAALEAINGIGTGNVTVTGPAAGPYTIEFTGALAGVDVPQLSTDSSGLSGGAATAAVETTVPVHNLTVISTETPRISSNGVIGASDDGHRMYFIAGGSQAVPGAPATGKRKLYLWQDVGGTPTLSFVGGISAGDTADVINPSWLLHGALARVTPDGQHLAFLVFNGSGPAPGYEHGDCGGGVPSCDELYVYSLDRSTPASPDVVCASCDLAVPQAPFETSLDIHAGVGAAGKTPHDNRILSDDGHRAFFTTAAPLLPEDTNDRLDAYEYDLETGAFHLLSSGTDPSDSYFMDASADGSNAYILTRQQLVGWDHDNAYDLYDVRSGGGFPEPPPTVAPCNGDSCLPTIPTPPNPNPIGSGLEGPGNPKSGHRCPKGKHAVKTRGKTRCVPRKHKQHKRHRRAGSNGGAGK